jgi:hypothetical protein
MGEARFVNYEEATRGIAKKKLKGTIWKWKEVVARLRAIDADSRVSAARRIVGLVDGDTGELMGRRAQVLGFDFPELLAALHKVKQQSQR